MDSIIVFTRNVALGGETTRRQSTSGMLCSDGDHDDVPRRMSWISLPSALMRWVRSVSKDMFSNCALSNKSSSCFLLILIFTSVLELFLFLSSPSSPSSSSLSFTKALFLEIPIKTPFGSSPSSLTRQFPILPLWEATSKVKEESGGIYNKRLVGWERQHKMRKTSKL